jgi:hypothetical protein
MLSIHSTSLQGRFWRGLLLFLAAMALAFALGLQGCAKAPIEVQGDSELASEVLKEALDRWKAGDKPDDLAQEKPAIFLADEDWKAGKKLKDYKVDENVVENGSHWRVFANLKLDSPQKGDANKKVCYAVTLGDSVSILRSDFLE